LIVFDYRLEIVLSKALIVMNTAHAGRIELFTAFQTSVIKMHFVKSKMEVPGAALVRQDSGEVEQNVKVYIFIFHCNLKPFLGTISHLVCDVNIHFVHSFECSRENLSFLLES